ILPALYRASGTIQPALKGSLDCTSNRERLWHFLYPGKLFCVASQSDTNSEFPVPCSLFPVQKRDVKPLLQPTYPSDGRDTQNLKLFAVYPFRTHPPPRNHLLLAQMYRS
ncbi:unnamed protein product, partial [Ectocarpus sp. 12 AP-2014]